MDSEQTDHQEISTSAPGARRLGTFGGVFTPSILTILGVVMYLLLPWTVGNLGLGGALLVISLAHIISLSTGLAVSSIATNRTVGAGGAYYMISRSLGAPAGAAVGIPLFFAQALSVAFYAVGFSESIIEILPASAFESSYAFLIDPRLGAVVVSFLLCLVAMRSAEAAIKVQYVVMGAIALSLVAVIFASPEVQPEQIEWFLSDERKKEIGARSFSEVFAVFFPAVTGIMAGVSMSGDLKDARRSLPKGTLLAIGAGYIVYMGIAVILGMKFTPAVLAQDTSSAPGIQNYVLFEYALWKPLVFLGLWGATLSSAVGSILAAPRTLQALAVDGVAPKILGRGRGPANEPVIGLWFCFGLAVVGMTLGTLDAIAQVLTIFFLATYGITNLACGLEIWASNPSFRPTFKISAWVPLLGAGACFYVMSIISFGSMLAAAAICLLIYTFVQRRSLNVTFGDARHGLWSALVRTALQHLHKTDYHDQNWRPNLLIFGGDKARRSHLLELGASVVQEQGITSYIEMLQGDVSDLASVRAEKQRALHGSQGDFSNVFFRVDIVPEVYRGIVTIAQSYGIGSLEANTVMLGWSSKEERADEYLGMLQELVLLENTLMLVNYDHGKHYGSRKEIHIWWRGLQANGGMMLLLAYLISADRRWRGARVKVITVVNSENDRVQGQARLKQHLKSARLTAEPVVLLSNEMPINDLMAEYSRDADLAIVGMRLPNKEDDAKQVFRDYNRLLASLPTTILVHSGGAFKAAPVLFDND